ncbi:MAG: protease inhibitor I42 family protein [Candidatus Omnitrophota bacterium]
MGKVTAIFIALMLMGLIGCETAEEIRLRAEGDSKINMKTGQALRIELEANATTGYMWSLTEPAEKGVLNQIGEHQYVRGSERIGAGGIQIYNFKALKRGRTELVFEYKRSWEKAKAPAKRYVISVAVH